MFEAQELPVAYSTIEHRAKLAQQLYDVAKEQIQLCERLVLDQHFQQQAWAAVVANLEDIIAEFKKRAEIFEKSFKEHINDHDSYLDFLKEYVYSRTHT